MYGKRVYRRRPRKYLRRRKTYGKRRSTVSGRIRKYVKSAIHRQIENKEKIILYANQSLICGDRISSSTTMINQVNQGITSETRTGNQIKIVRGIWRVAVNILPYNATSNPSPLPCWVKCWVVRDLKNTGQLTNMDSTSYTSFFRGNGTSLPFQNNTLDIVADVNKENFRVLYSKTFKLGQSTSYATITAGGYNDNSPMSKYFTINWGKWCKKQLKYQDNAYYPMNENLYFVLQAVPCDGTSCDGKSLIEYHFTNAMHYEDA